MRLEKLELFGFKSFARRTQLRFSPGITAVVGPNGCGKSNISDAIRWALGEQNVRNLRGKQLSDVIFKGTREAKPMGMAEVVLQLENRDQRLSSEYEDVRIERRAFRSGESEFKINQNPCRLKDIRGLFMDTGLGSAEYAVIEREMIDEVLADRDRARRFLLDEASGITRYKVQRKETLRKIEAVEADLVRIEDALEIEEREVRSLAYQMGKARRYQRLCDRIRDIDVALARLRWRELQALASGESDRVGEEERQREALRTRVHRLEADQEEARLGLLERKRQLNALQVKLGETDRELGHRREDTLVREERIRALRERIADREARITRQRQEAEAAGAAAAELEPQVAELTQEQERRGAIAAEAEAEWKAIDRQLRGAREELAREQQLQLEQVRKLTTGDQQLQALQGRIGELEQRAQAAREQRSAFGARRRDLGEQLDRLRERHARLAGEEQAAGARAAELSTAREQAAAELGDLRQRREALANEEARRESRVHLLTEQARGFEGYQESVAQLLAHRDELPGVIGAAAELVAIAPAWRERLAPALRELTNWVVTETEAAAWDAIAWLRERGLGQLTFFPLETSPPEGEAAGLPEEALHARTPAGAALVAYLRHMIVPVTGRAAVPSPEEREPGRCWVTAGGEVLAAAGWLSGGGAGSPEAQLWQRPEEIATLREKLAQDVAERTRLQTEQDALAKRQTDLTGEMQQLEQARQERRATLENVSRAVAEREAEERLVAGEVDRLAEEVAELTGRRESLEREIAGSRQHQEAAQAEGDSADHRLQAAAGRVEELAAEKDRLGEWLTEKKMEQLWAETRMRDVVAARDQQRATREAAERRSAEMEHEITAAREEMSAQESQVATGRQAEAELLERQADQRQGVDHEAQEQTRIEDDLLGRETKVREKRRALSELEETLRQNEVRLARVEAEQERLGERIQEQYGLELRALETAPPEPVEASASSATALPGPEAVLADLTPEAAREKLKVLVGDRERLGPVNVLAIEEHERKREHVRFIKTQRDDLLKSKEQMLAAIERINQEARRMFAETFEQVQHHFVETFGTLFPGGEARMRLAGDDPLEADIEIVARPRGKRLESIRLLSSGERALTATALLFAVYLVKPSPFCVLDELDAPLDDANIERFLNLLRSFSERTQFIVITHNKMTMEVADTLYGVTMQDPGISRIVSVRLEGGSLVTDDRLATQALARLS